MNKQKPILTFISLVLVLFLFTPVLIRTLIVSGEPDFKHFFISASKGTPSKLDTQLPFEEREKEEEASSHSLASLPLIAVLSEPFFFQQSANLIFHPHQVSLKCEEQPRYLIIRSLLI
jgi:hypothetical protein